MTRDELKQAIVQTLQTVAPEMDPMELQPDKALRVQLDIDSMDALNFFIRLHQKLDIEIPEADYGKLNTLDECIAYVVGKKG